METAMRPLNRLNILALLAAIGASPTLAADAGKGETIAVRWCAACHIVKPGQNQAKADAPPFTAIATRRTHEDLRLFLANPYPRMPDMSLTREEIADLVAFIKSYGLAPGETPPAPPPVKDEPARPRPG
jgi:mono/diheme cytochrome c family protein